MVSLLTSASFSYRPSINQCFIPLISNLTPLLVRKELQDGLALENMLVMPSPTNSLMMTPRKSSTDLLSDPQILPIPTSVWSRQDDSQAATNPMAEYNPDDLIGTPEE